jgi:hypothetical protein
LLVLLSRDTERLLHHKKIYRHKRSLTNSILFFMDIDINHACHVAQAGELQEWRGADGSVIARSSARRNETKKQSRTCATQNACTLGCSCFSACINHHVNTEDDPGLAEKVKTSNAIPLRMKLERRPNS